MNNSTVVGYRNGTSKKTGKPYVCIYYTYEGDDITGVGSDSLYCSPEVIYGELRIGRQIDIRYNRNGFVDTVTVIG